MNILVCIKQVPNTGHMTIDPKTNRLVRHGINLILNPADRYVLEKALRLKEQFGGRITVISMGAPQAADELKAAYMVGADRCVLLTDPDFGGSDTFATASVLAAAIRYEEQQNKEPFDIIFCGKNTIDGETGQVGPEMAEILGIHHFTNISRMDYTGISFQIEYTLDEKKFLVNASLPVLVTYPLSGDVFLRSAILERLEKADEIVIPTLSFTDLHPWLERAEIGLQGSATKVVRSYVPSVQRKSVIIDQGTAKEKVQTLVGHLKEKGLFGGENITSNIVYDKHNNVNNGRICVFVEQNKNGSCKSLGLELLTPAIEIGTAAKLQVSVLLAGSDNRKAELELSQYPIDEIISCEDSKLNDHLTTSYVEALAGMIEEYKPEGLLIGGTEFGKELAARIAARFHTGLTAECTSVWYDTDKEGIIWSRPAYGGKLMADIICRKKRPQMGTVRDGVFIQPAKCKCSPKVIRVSAPESLIAERVQILEKWDTPGFSIQNGNEISMVVGMGKGIRDIDGFDICCDFADAIGADIGASRGAVELRIISPKYQIGVNGRTLRPTIYFACGISGSAMHMAGVPDARCVVAINSDPKAEIFQIADYGIVGNLFEIVPELQKEMEQLKR